MTRVTQAFERARAAQEQGRGGVLAGLTAGASVETFDALDEFGAVAETPQRSIRRPSVAGTEIPEDQPATRTPMVTRCPRCERFQRASAQQLGLWDKMLSLIRVRSHRCDFCGHRFHRFNVDPSDVLAAPVPVNSTFLPAADGRDFDELISDIAHDERNLQNGHVPDAYAVPKRPPPIRRVQGTPTAPAVDGNVKDDRSTPLNRSDWTGP